MKFVIFININTDAQNAPNGPDMEHIFKWDLRRWIGSDGRKGEITEQGGPTLATGTASSVEGAKATAQAYANFYAMETAYVYDTEPDAQVRG